MKKIFSTTLGVMASVAAMISLNPCSSCSQSQGELADFEDKDDTTLIVSAEVVGDMIQNISSPVEMANEIKNSGVQFSQSTLNAAGQEGKYETSFKRAINLGVYAADLGYINTFPLLSRMAKDNTNLDSLKQLSVSSFNEIDKYLREQKRSNVSTAIVVGTWIEGIHITNSVIEQTKSRDLINRLGEQKNIVEILQIVIHTYARSDSDFNPLAKEIDELKAIYDNVRITTEMGQPVTKEVDGMLVIEQNEITTVEITDEQVAQIIAKIKDIRAGIVG